MGVRVLKFCGIAFKSNTNKTFFYEKWFRTFHHKESEKQCNLVTFVYRILEAAFLSGWWFQPIWKILVKWEIFPQIGVNIKKYLKPAPSYQFFRWTPTWLSLWIWAKPLQALVSSTDASGAELQIPWHSQEMWGTSFLCKLTWQTLGIQIIPPEVWCFRYVLGVQTPSQEVALDV